jgi:hypothetical protein
MNKENKENLESMITEASTCSCTETVKFSDFGHRCIGIGREMKVSDVTGLTQRFNAPFK